MTLHDGRVEKQKPSRNIPSRAACGKKKRKAVDAVSTTDRLKQLLPKSGDASASGQSGHGSGARSAPNGPAAPAQADEELPPLVQIGNKKNEPLSSPKASTKKRVGGRREAPATRERSDRKAGAHTEFDDDEKLKSINTLLFLGKIRDDMLPVMKALIRVGQKYGYLTDRDADKLFDCVDHLEFEEVSEGFYRITSLRRCKMRHICPICAEHYRWTHSKRFRADIVSILKVVRAARVWEILITVKPGYDLRERVTTLREGITRLADHGTDVRGREREGINTASFFATVLAGAGIIEVTRVPKGGKKHAGKVAASGKRIASLWYPHLHAFLVTDLGFDREGFLQEASRILGPGFEIKLKPLEADAKYLKSVGMEHNPGGLTKLQQAARMREVQKAIRQRTDYITKSELAEIRKRLPTKEEIEEGEPLFNLGTVLRGFMANESLRPRKKDGSGKRDRSPVMIVRLGAAMGIKRGLEKLRKLVAKRKAEDARKALDGKALRSRLKKRRAGKASQERGVRGKRSRVVVAAERARAANKRKRNHQ